MKKSIIINPLLENEDPTDYHLMIEKIICDGYFDVLEIWDTLDKKVLDIFAKYSKYIEFDVSLSPLMSSNHLSLNSDIHEITEKSMQYVFNRLKLLAELGVRHISISSPNVCTNINRAEQIYNFNSVLKNICVYAKTYNISVCFEGFDISVDKKRLLGVTSELYDFFELLQNECPNLFLTWDLAHICLEGTDYLDSLNKLNKYIGRIHISNYSLDKEKWFYGDKHLPFGKFGCISNEDIQNVINYAKRLSNISVAFEVASHKKIKGIDSFKHTYSYLSALTQLYLY